MLNESGWTVCFTGSSELLTFTWVRKGTNQADHTLRVNLVLAVTCYKGGFNYFSATGMIDLGRT